MNNRSETVCRQTIEYLWKEFKKGHRIKQLIENIPIINTNALSQITFQMVYSEQMPQPIKTSIIEEDHKPSYIAFDTNANFQIECEQQQTKQASAEQSQLAHQKQAAQAKKIKHSRNSQNHSQVLEPAADKKVFALSEPPLSVQQLQLQQELGHIKKQLYLMRKLRKQNEQEEKSRLEKQFNRKNLELPGKQITFDFSGEIFLKQKPALKKHLLVPTHAQSVDLARQKAKQKAVQEDNDSESRGYLLSRGGANSRERQRLLFGNMEKRQISHLPFIKLTQNVKISENNKKSAGINSSRLTLKSYQSKGQSSFRHFQQIKKDNAAERLFSLKRSSEVSAFQDIEDSNQPLQVVFQQKRQSKRMQKYLRKLCQDKNKDFVSEINRSSNFDRQNSPHDYSVHKYYKHNFDEDKRGICEHSLADLKISGSFSKELKFTQ